MASRKIVTPVFRASYLNVLQPKENKGQYGTSYTYQVTMIFDPQDPQCDMSEINAIIQEAIDERWKGQPPKTGVKSPLRDGVWKTPQNPRGFNLDQNPEYEGMIVAVATGYTKKLSNGDFDRNSQVGVVGPDGLVLDPAIHPVYSGMYARAKISAYTPKAKGRAGIDENQVTLALHHLQKCYDGEPLSGSNGKAEDAFDAFDVPAAIGQNHDLLGDI